jgi:putative transposase
MLKQHQAGLEAKELCRKYSINDATFYKWRSRYGGMEVSDAKRLKALKDENRRLKKLLAETALDAATLQEMLGKTSDAQGLETGSALGDPGERLFPPFGPNAASSTACPAGAVRRRLPTWWRGFSVGFPMATSPTGSIAGRAAGIALAPLLFPKRYDLAPKLSLTGVDA